MKRWLGLSLTMLLLFLTGCSAGARDEESFLRWQTALREAETISFSADVDARAGEEIFSYGADCLCRAEEICRLYGECEERFGIQTAEPNTVKVAVG